MRTIDKVRLIMIVGISVIVAFGCKKDFTNVNFVSFDGSNSDAAVATLQNIDITKGELGVVVLPSSVASDIRSEFKWYTKVMAPNGKPIHFLAQHAWTVEKVAYVRAVLEHYLTDIPGVAYGQKGAVANKMADYNAAMTMYNTTAGTNRSVTGQDLQANETVDVGSPEYLDLSVRNAALEEVLHFLQDYGMTPVYAVFQDKLGKATVYAMNNQIFIPWAMLPVADYDNEHLAAYNDAYWGAMEHRGNNTPYLFTSREACIAGDPMTTAIVKDFQTEYFASTLNIASSFSGTFYMTKQRHLRYTNQSQYYKDMKLLGKNNSNIIGNKYNNVLTGNEGKNELTGGKGNDVLNGQAGEDIAIYQGAFAEYEVDTKNGMTTITDKVSERDGKDTLQNIERIKFSDRTVVL